MGMSQNRNHQLAHEAMEAAEIAVDVYCKANGVDPFDIAPELFETFLDVALLERFSPHTKMCDIFPGATSKTLGEMTRNTMTRH